jgi:hypothetical protein
MKLFNKTIDRQLFKQYSLGSDLSKQEVVVKIFNPYGNGTWFILNSDPQDPDYLWAIVDLGYGAEVGSVSRNDLETYRGKFGLGFERDLGFDPINAEELYKGLRQGKSYAEGGEVSFIDYKDSEIMYEPNYKKYYANDVEFDTLKQAQAFIDSGKIDPSIRDAYSKGLFADGGSLEDVLSQDVTFLKFDSHRAYDSFKKLDIPHLQVHDYDFNHYSIIKTENLEKVLGFVKKGLRVVKKKFTVDDLGFDYKGRTSFEEGGDLESFSDNQQMIMNQNVEVEHHHEELEDILENKVPVPAWVVAKMETATQNLSDITHYLDGQKELMEDENEDEDENEEDDENQDEIENKEVVEPINVSAETKAELTKKFTDDALGNLKGFLKGMEGIDLRDDYTFDYKDEQYEIEPIINSDENSVSNAVFTIFDGDEKEVGEITYSSDGGKQKFNANSEFFSWNNTKFEDGGFMNGVYEDGGEIKDETKKAMEWWGSLSINQQKEFAKNYNNGYRYPYIFDYGIAKNVSKNLYYKIIQEIWENEGKPKAQENKKFADGGYFDGAIPKTSSYMSNFAKGGDIDVEYWLSINKEFGKPKWQSQESQDFNEVFNEVIDVYNRMLEFQDEPKVTLEENKKIKQLAQKFFKIKGFVTFNIIEGMANKIIKPRLKLVYYAKGGMVVTSIKDIPNFEERLNQRRITYRGLGMGKLFDDFYNLAGTSGTRIKVDGKEYFITDKEFNTFSRDADGKMQIRFDAPARKNEDGGFMSDVYAKGGGIGDNVLGLVKGDIFEVIDTEHTVTGNKFVFLDYEDKYGTIALKAIPYPPMLFKKLNDKDKIVYITDISSDGIKKLSDDKSGEMLVRRYKKYIEYNMEQGGETEEGVDLFEDYENIPPKLQAVLDNYEYAFQNGDYRDLEKALKEANGIGYTFEYSLDGQAYNLRKIGQKGKSEVEEYSQGGTLKKYILKADIKTVTLKRNGKEVTYKGSDILNDANAFANIEYLMYKANYISKDDVVRVELKNGTTVKPVEGYWIKKDAEPEWLSMNDILDYEDKTKKNYAKGGTLKKYIIKADIKTVTLKRNGKELTYKGADVLNGANVFADGGDLTSKANYIPKRDVVSVELNDGTIVKPINGYWIKKGAEPITSKQKFTSKDLPKNGSPISIKAPAMSGAPAIDLVLKYDSKNFRFDVYKDGIKKDMVGEKEVLNNLNSGIYVFTDKSTPTTSGKYNAVAFEGKKQMANLSDNEYSDKIDSFIKSNEEKGFEVIVDLMNNGKVEQQVYKTYSNKNNEPKLGQTYIRKDARNNWKAETTVDDFNGYDWRISTVKTYSGKLISSAQGGKTEETGSKGIVMFKYTMYEDPNYTLEVSIPKRLSEKLVTEQHEKALSKFKKFMETGMFKGGGKISNFDKLSDKVAKEYEGKPVKSQYQEEYGKYYSEEEAQEVGDKVAGKVKAMQPAKKDLGGETKKTSSSSKMLMRANQLAKEIRKEGESWNDAKKRAFAQLKK